MSSMYTKNLKISLFGESHSPAIGVVIDGLKAGLKLDLNRIKFELLKRKPQKDISTPRQEEDDFKILSGFFNGHTTGTPLAIVIENKDVDSSNYFETKDFLSSSLADYTVYLMFYGYQDYRGGGHFSGRITSLLVIVGAICQQILEKKHIKIGTHIKNIHGVEDIDFDLKNPEKEISKLNNEYFATLDDGKREEMIAEIKKAAAIDDSVGGTLETIVIGDIAGLGEPFFDSVESTLSSLLFSIPAVKGVEFGLGFGFKDKFGSEVNDAYYYDGGIKTKTNNNGGINGGITNGMPIIVKTVIKPTPSIPKVQDTVNIMTNENVKIKFAGRFDPCIVHRARVVVDSVIAIGLVDLAIAKYGYDWMEV